ncbi:hypothetical protein ACM66B_005442 [Microbotryomycetes sp. NB124-2]
MAKAKGGKSGSSRAGRTIVRINSLPRGLSCQPCRDRRVRCDAQKPACGACLRKAKWDGRNVDAEHGCVYVKEPTTPALKRSKHTSSAKAGPSRPKLAPVSELESICTASVVKTAHKKQVTQQTLSSSASNSTDRPQQPSTVRSASETSKASVAMNSTGPLQKGLACLSCKIRRVKCDGLKPSCSSCIRNARWQGRDPEHDHGCIYVPSSSVSIPSYSKRRAATASSMSAQFAPASSSSSSSGKLHLLHSPDAPASPKLLSETLPPLPVDALLQMASSVAARPFKHAPESPRSVPSLTSSNETVASPLPSPLMSPHGTPHVFFGHDLLPVSYPPVPYPPTDFWDGDDFKLPGPAFDFSNVKQFKRGASDGYLWESDSTSFAPSSSGLSLSLSGMQLVSEHGEDALMKVSPDRASASPQDDVVLQHKRQRVMSPHHPIVDQVFPSNFDAIGDKQESVEDQAWKIELGGCLAEELTVGWGLS